MAKSTIVFFCLLVATMAFGHGEDSVGPHGGEIRMPGVFHTELVKTKNPKIWRVYLLDISFKDPVTKDSSVSLTFAPKIAEKHQEKTKNRDDVGGLAATCKAKRDFFECVLPASLSQKAGTLEVLANRLGLPGERVAYDIP